MTWRKPGNRDLAEAIVQTFHDSPERSREKLSHFSAKAWKKTDYWLEASGLALYFLDHAESLGIAEGLDTATLEHLRKDLADNTVRRAAMLTECIAINHAFRDAGVRYANVKGFTLCPDSCPKPALRHQIDFDFLVDGEDLLLARSCLEARGYELAGVTHKAWEFKAGNYSSRSSENNYKAGGYRAAELHFLPRGEALPVRDVRMERLGEWMAEGESFPALSSADQLLGLGLHLFG
ncbi:MAG TPA: nucleotidyltransferase family protein, partial [Acidobacteriaceae bacterium]